MDAVESHSEAILICLGHGAQSQGQKSSIAISQRRRN